MGPNSDYQIIVSPSSARKNRHKYVKAHLPELAMAHSLSHISARFLRASGLAIVFKLVPNKK